jgi:hypothetical protein
MRIKPILYGVLVSTVFFGVILGFQAAGIWSISGKVTADGEAIQPAATDVNTIKGWMTLEQIATTYNVHLADLLIQFGLPADTPSSTAIKDLESDTFDTTALRTWLQSRAQPANIQQLDIATSAEPQPAASTPVDTQQTVSTPEIAAALTPIPTEHVAPAKTITGKTTFQELLDWGVPEDAIRNIIGGELPGPGTVLKDYVTAKGLEFATVKNQLQAEVDKTK